MPPPVGWWSVWDGIIEPGRGILGVQFLGHRHTRARPTRAFLFIVGFAQIAADQGVVGVQAGGNLEFPPPSSQIALADLGQPQTQPRQGVSLIQHNRPFKRLLRLCSS